MERALGEGLNLRRVDSDTVGVSLDETCDLETVESLGRAFGCGNRASAIADHPSGIPGDLERSSEFLTHRVFNSYRSETEMLRYIRRLADKDIALDRGMIPLGSCTMKLNATSEMEPITWPEFSDMHPFAPLDQAQGYIKLIAELEEWLLACTGYDEYLARLRGAGHEVTESDLRELAGVRQIFVFGPDGALYLTDDAAGLVYRIAPP